MKKIYSALAALLITCCAFAQTPQYFYSYFTTPPPPPGIIGDSTVLCGLFTGLGIDSVLLQNIYHPADLGNPPEGMITHIYLRVLNLLNPNQTVHKVPKLRILLGRTDVDSFTEATNETATYCTNIDDQSLTTVIAGDPYVFPDTFINYGWTQLPLQNQFYYNPARNLVLELFNGRNDTGNINNAGPELISSGHSIPPHTELPPHFANSRSYQWDTASNSLFYGSHCGGNYRIDFGFDLDTSIHLGVTKNPQLLQATLYPNPAQDRLMVYGSLQNPAQQLSFTLSSLAGKTVWQQQRTGGISGNFTQEITLSQLPKGFYFLTLQTDNERLVMKVVKE